MDQEPLAVVLAAGKGTRMESDLPKVLFPVCGRPMIAYVLDALTKAGIRRKIVVVGYRAELVEATLGMEEGVEFARQTEQLGTGHAVMMCLDRLQAHRGPVVVVTGDSPLVQSDSVAELLAEFRKNRPACILGTLHKPDPRGLGRIVRDERGDFLGIVEQKDATVDQQKITEVNMSTYLFEAQELVHALGRIERKNAQGEYYLTDCPGILRSEGKKVLAQPRLRPCEAVSVNTLAELGQAEAELRRLGLGQ